MVRDGTGEPLAAGDPPRLGRAAFAGAVRDALRDLGRANGSRGSALLDTWAVVVRARNDASDRTAALRRIIADAAAESESSPLDRAVALLLSRALDS